MAEGWVPPGLELLPVVVLPPEFPPVDEPLALLHLDLSPVIRAEAKIID